MASIEKHIVSRQFRKCRYTYNDEAFIQKHICNTLMEMLLGTGNPVFRKAFEIGCGTGLLTQQLVEQCTIHDLLVNDLVKEYEHDVNRILQAYPSINHQFIVGDADRIDYPPSCDLVISSSTLQWIDDPESVFEKAHNSLLPGGMMAFSVYGPWNFREIWEITGNGLVYHSFHQLEILLREKGFELIHAHEEQFVQMFDTPTQVLQHMKKTGVNAVSSKGWYRNDVAKFCARYLKEFGQASGVGLTFHPMYFVMKKQTK